MRELLAAARKALTCQRSARSRRDQRARAGPEAKFAVDFWRLLGLFARHENPASDSAVDPATYSPGALTAPGDGFVFAHVQLD